MAFIVNLVAQKRAHALFPTPPVVFTVHSCTSSLSRGDSGSSTASALPLPPCPRPRPHGRHPPVYDSLFSLELAPCSSKIRTSKERQSTTMCLFLHGFSCLCVYTKPLHKRAQNHHMILMPHSCPGMLAGISHIWGLLYIRFL